MAGSLPDPLKLFNKPAAPVIPPPSPPPPAPNLADAQDRVRRQQQDEALRKRGRSSTVVTGNEGVGDTPVARKTLVGS